MDSSNLFGERKIEQFLGSPPFLQLVENLFQLPGVVPSITLQPGANMVLV
jgi:hypothetical protein